MKGLLRYAKAAADLQLLIAAFAVFAILLTVSVDVSLRAAANAPLGATLEIVSFYYMIPLVFLPLMSLEMEDGHIHTDLFYRLFPRGMQRISHIVSALITTGIYALLAYVTFKQAIISTRSGEVAMGVSLLPIWPVRWVLPAVFATTTFASALSSVARIARGGTHD